MRSAWSTHAFSPRWSSISAAPCRTPRPGRWTRCAKRPSPLPGFYNCLRQRGPILRTSQPAGSRDLRIQTVWQNAARSSSEAALFKRERQRPVVERSCGRAPDRASLRSQLGISPRAAGEGLRAVLGGAGPRRRVVSDPADPRLKEPKFKEAPVIVANNDSKYLINKGDDEELVSSVAVSSRAGSSHALRDTLVKMKMRARARNDQDANLVLDEPYLLPRKMLKELLCAWKSHCLRVPYACPS